MADDWMSAVPGGIGASAPAPPPAAAPSFPMVEPHPAPDGSGGMTNLSDEDYGKFMRGESPPASSGKPDNAWMNAIPDATPKETTPPPQSWHDWAFGPPNPNDFSQQLVGSTAAALHAIPRGLLGGKTVDYGEAITGAPMRMVYGDIPPTPQQPEGQMPPEQEQTPFGPRPPQGFRLISPRAAIDEGLNRAEQQNRFFRQFSPIADVGGELMGGAASGVAASPALARTVTAAGAPLLAKAGNAASYLARNAGFGGMMGSLAGSDPVEGAETGAAVGATLPAVISGTVAAVKPVVAPMAKPAISAFRRIAPLFSEGGRQTSVGNVLNREIGPVAAETSPVGRLDLAQATNNPEAAARVDIAKDFNADAHSALRGAQQDAVAEQIGRIGAPSTTADASTSGVKAIRDLRALARKREGELWNVPALTDVMLPTAPMRQTSRQALNAVQKDDPGLMLGMTSHIKDALSGIEGLPEHANLQNINSFLGVLKGVSRKPPPDNPRAGALASRLLDTIEKSRDEAITSSGAPSNVIDAYNAARDFTRRRAGIFGTQDMRQILAKNPEGHFQADESEAMKKFFNFSSGSGEGPANIKELTDFADEIKQAWVGRGAQFMETADARNSLRDAARSYVASALTDAARVNEGQTLNPATLQKFLRTNRPWMEKSGMFSQSQIGAADALLDYAEMLRRPDLLRRQVNSATSERITRKDTFIDQIMSPWIRHLAALASTAGGGHQHGMVGAGLGLMVGSAFEGAVTGAEASMRRMMAEALLNPEIARAYQMKASAANRLMLSPEIRASIDRARAAIGSDMASQMAPRLKSEPAGAMSEQHE